MSTEIQQIELSIEEAQKMVDRKNQLEKLFGNREFKKVVLDGYFKEEAARLATLTGDSALVAQRPEIFLAIQSIAKLQEYFRTVALMGNSAEAELAEAQEVLDELRAEAA